MLKKSKTLLALFLSACMVFSLAACSNDRDSDRKSDREEEEEDVEAIDVDDFEDVMEDMDYETYEDVGDDNIDTSMYAYDEDYAFFVTFEEYYDEDDAVDEFEDSIDDIKEVEEDGDFEGSIKESGSGNFRKCILKGDFDETSDMFDGEMYVVFVRVDNILISVSTASTDEDAVKTVKKIVKELGY